MFPHLLQSKFLSQLNNNCWCKNASSDYRHIYSTVSKDTYNFGQPHNKALLSVISVTYPRTRLRHRESSCH